MKILVTGVAGQLGYDVVNELTRRGHTAIGTDVAESSLIPTTKLDITDRSAVCELISNIKPDAVIHCAAWTAVDAAEDAENCKKVFAINEEGTANIAQACRDIDCKMIYISTDYVFSGQGTDPWKADCKEYSPLNVYGESKLNGELAVSAILDKYFIVRIAWVFGKTAAISLKLCSILGKNTMRFAL